LGAAGTRSTPSGEITVTLAANPSHLEAVDPVVEGRARAEQTDRSTRYGLHDPNVALPVLIHGDASFPGQGVVAETLNLSALVGYRRHGHNEQDEAAYTQPLMTAQIAEHPTVREQFAQQLVAEAVLTEEEADQLSAEVTSELKQAHEALKATFGVPHPAEGKIPFSSGDSVVTAVAADRLRELNDELLRVPEHFTVHPKLLGQLQRRLKTIDEGGIDWGQAEALAFGSLLVEGIPIRLTGQDTQRGTFSHRHAVLHDVHTG